MALRGTAEPTEILHGKLFGMLVIDKTLTIPGACADAEATGNAIKAVEEKAVKSQASADNAQKTAGEARKVADGAVKDATKAKNAADDAQTTANKAQTAVDNLKKEMDTVKEDLGSLQSKVDEDCEPKRLEFHGTAVPRTAFAADDAYEDYPYRAAIPLPGVLGSMTPDVTFAVPDAVSGSFAPVAECYAGGVYIWAASVPEGTTTIPTIKCWKAVS